jgi:hypothetical protein
MNVFPNSIPSIKLLNPPCVKNILTLSCFNRAIYGIHFYVNIWGWSFIILSTSGSKNYALVTVITNPYSFLFTASVKILLRVSFLGRNCVPNAIRTTLSCFNKWLSNSCPSGYGIWIILSLISGYTNFTLGGIII